MNFVYICKDGENEELRYSIRSVVKNTNDPKIWVVGGKPDWYVGNYISVLQDQHKYQNALNNLRAACASEEIPEDFILMNDDFYITNKIDEVKIYNNGSLEDQINQYHNLGLRSTYLHRLGKTYAYLQRRDIPNPISYEIHVPMPMKKSKLITILEENYSTLWRSKYGNTFNIGGETVKDVKVHKSGGLVALSYNQDQEQIPYLSSADSSFMFLLDYLTTNFSEKSTYER
jgi:hypothetical protein